MTTSDEAYEQKVEQAFFRVINSHGYGFHYSVLKLVYDLAGREGSLWYPEVAEFPVHVQGYDTRIDLILRHCNFPFYIVGECKRANPALNNWCFVRAPFVQRDRLDYEPRFIEQLHRDENGEISVFSTTSSHLRDAFHIAREIKSDEKGDISGPNRGVIEEAATQLCRGTNGFIEFLARNTQVLHNSNNAYFLPVIFTTAHLWASNINLSSADIETGNIHPLRSEFTKTTHVFYQYHLSPSLKHSYRSSKRFNRLGELLDSEYVRTIAIVNASAVKEFLALTSNWNFY